jgi:hypothetical protein
MAAFHGAGDVGSDRLPEFAVIAAASWLPMIVWCAFSQLPSRA